MLVVFLHYVSIPSPSFVAPSLVVASASRSPRFLPSQGPKSQPPRSSRRYRKRMAANRRKYREESIKNLPLEVHINGEPLPSLAPPCLPPPLFLHLHLFLLLSPPRLSLSLSLPLSFSRSLCCRPLLPLSPSSRSLSSRPARQEWVRGTGKELVGSKATARKVRVQLDESEEVAIQ